VAAVAIPFVVAGGGFVVTGVRYRRNAANFATLAPAMNDRTPE